MQSLYVFVAAFLLDWTWVYYTRATVEHRAFSAAVWAGLIMALSGYNFASLVEHWSLVLPAMVGAAVGTYTAIAWKIERW